MTATDKLFTRRVRKSSIVTTWPSGGQRVTYADGRVYLCAGPDYPWTLYTTTDELF